jgi:hypothetical protein
MLGLWPPGASGRRAIDPRCAKLGGGQCDYEDHTLNGFNPQNVSKFRSIPAMRVIAFATTPWSQTIDAKRLASLWFGAGSASFPSSKPMHVGKRSEPNRPLRRQKE